MKGSKPQASVVGRTVKRPRVVATTTSTRTALPIAAAGVHRGFSTPIATTQPAVMPATAQPVKEAKAGWGTILGSLLLALGFASAFLGPIIPRGSVTPAATESIGGVVLGEAQSLPLKVTVTVQLPSRRQVLAVQPPSGTLTEALARAAKQGDSNFVYTTRGSSIYVDTFFGQPANGTGQWFIFVNGNQVTDLSTIALSQGDEVKAHWVAQP